jgi:preprotein translocase subunit YajC
MFITPAFAQATGSDPLGGVGGLLFPMLMMIVIFYFLVIRPQQQRAKQHREMVNQVRRGDTVVTSGGFGPSIERPMAMAYLPAGLAEGTVVYGEVRGRRLPAVIVPMPFQPNRYKR